MQCPEFTQRLQLQLDQRVELEEDGELQAHADQCPACAARLNTWWKIATTFHTAEMPEPSVDFAERAVRAATGPRSTRPPARWMTISVGGLTVAAAVLLMLHSVQQPDGAGTQPSPIAAMDREQPTAGPVTSAHGRLAGDPAVPDAFGKQETDSEVVTQEEYRQLIHDLIARLSEAHLEELESVDELAGTIRPLAATLNAAISAFRRSLPVG